MAGYVFVLLTGLAAGTLSGVVGTGASILLLPVLIYQFGPQPAVAIMAIAAVFLNVGKATSWWRMVHWKAFAAYSVLGVPAVILGARTLLILPPNTVEVLIGGFFLVMIPLRRWMRAREFRLRLWQLSMTGGVIGFLSGIALSTGPLSIPAFLAAGLTQGALLSTEAVASLALMVGKVATFQQMGALPPDLVVQGLIVGTASMAGTYVGKWVVLRMSLKAFEHALDVMLLCSGLSLLWAALH